MKIDTHREDSRGNVFTLLEAIEYKGLVIPAGFESDGASVPRIFWRLIFPPTDTRAIRAAVIHDWIYRNQPIGWTRPETDKVFREILIEDGMGKWRSWAAWLGVRIGGGWAWEKGKFEKALGSMWR